MALITCRNAAFAYEGNIVVKDLNFEVNNGDYLCIVGENGSGKTTLMKGLLGLIRPASGTIEMGEGLKSTEIGYLPQQHAAQKDFPASVYEIVLSGRLNSRSFLRSFEGENYVEIIWSLLYCLIPFYGLTDRRVANQNMDKLGISSIKWKSFRELSGGQQQRVLLARALCATDKVLLLDEPVTGLDPLVTAELYQTIQTLRQELGITIIMISHDIRAAVEYCDQILHLQNEQVFFGATKEYKKTEIGKRFLGTLEKGEA